MSNPIPSYPFDPTGVLPACRITGEQQILSGGQDIDYYFIVPKIAPIFAASFSATITNGGAVRPLVLNQDFYFSHYFISASRACAKELYGSISILNPTLVGVITMSYQTLGGDWVIDDAQIAEILANQTYNPRTYSWENVADLPYAFPVIDHEWDLVDMVGMSQVADAVRGVETAMRQSNNASLEAHLANLNNPHGTTPEQIGAYSIAQTDQRINLLVAAALENHTGAPDPHPQYLTEAKASTLIDARVGLVRQPKNVVPASQATNVSQTVVLQSSQYYSLYGVAQNAAQFQVSTRQDFGSVAVESGTLGAVTSYAVTAGLSANTAYFWRCRHRDSDGVWSAWSQPTAFSTGSIIVQQPSVTAPTPGQTGVSPTFTALSSAFAISGGADTHQSTDWEIRTQSGGLGTLAYGLTGSTSNKTNLPVPAGALSPNQTYYIRVRYRATNAGSSAWSADVNFTTSGVVQTPVINSPVNNSTNVGETPTIATGNFSVVGGTDTHQSSDWQIWTGPNGTGTKVFEKLGSTADKLSTLVPVGSLAVNTTYYARARHNGTAMGASGWSVDSKFTTASQFVPTVAGTPYGGGYYVGRVIDDSSGSPKTYAIVAAPKSQGEYSGAFCAQSPAPFWPNNPALRGDKAYGPAQFSYLAASATGVYPPVDFVKNMNNAAVGGYSDWYIASRDEWELLYRSLHSSGAPGTSGLNITGNRSGDSLPQGTNLNSSPPGGGYSEEDPLQTSVQPFVLPQFSNVAGIEHLNGVYFTASWSGQTSNSDNRMWAQRMDDGFQSIYAPNAAGKVRAIRRILIG